MDEDDLDQSVEMISRKNNKHKNYDNNNKTFDVD